MSAFMSAKFDAATTRARRPRPQQGTEGSVPFGSGLAVGADTGTDEDVLDVVAALEAGAWVPLKSEPTRSSTSAPFTVGSATSVAPLTRYDWSTFALESWLRP